MFSNGTHSSRRESAPRGADSFLKELVPFEKGGKKKEQTRAPHAGANTQF